MRDSKKTVETDLYPGAIGTAYSTDNTDWKECVCMSVYVCAYCSVKTISGSQLFPFSSRVLKVHLCNYFVTRKWQYLKVSEELGGEALLEKCVTWVGFEV